MWEGEGTQIGNPPPSALPNWTPPPKLGTPSLSTPWRPQKGRPSNWTPSLQTGNGDGDTMGTGMGTQRGDKWGHNGDSGEDTVGMGTQWGHRGDGDGVTMGFETQWEWD